MDPAPRLEPIPHPPGHIVVGNLLDLNASHPIESLMELARKYGPVFEFAVPGRGARAIVSSYALVNELCDESRFDKMVGGGLSTLAKGPVGRGLFTSETHRPELAQGAQCVAARVQHGRDVQLLSAHAGSRRSTHAEMGTAEP